MGGSPQLTRHIWVRLMVNVPTLKMYVASILAQAAIIDTEDEKQDTLLEHEPMLIPAKTIEGAAHAARELAFKRWPVDRGFYGHTAIIVPVTKDFFANVKRIRLTPDTGEPEPAQRFRFE